MNENLEEAANAALARVTKAADPVAEQTLPAVYVDAIKEDVPRAQVIIVCYFNDGKVHVATHGDVYMIDHTLNRMAKFNRREILKHELEALNKELDR